MRVLLIRADAGTDIGAGHFMRSLALAEAWREKGGKAVFLSRCPAVSLRSRAEDLGVAVLPLAAEPGTAADLAETLAILRTEGGEACLCLDGYLFDPDFQLQARQVAHTLLVVDDIAHQSAYHAHLLLNQNVGSDELAYRVDPDTRLLLGPRYALLRSEFRTGDVPAGPVRPIAYRVLVTLGGADPDNFTLKAMRALTGIDLPGLKVTVVMGGTNPHRAAVELAAVDLARRAQVEFVHDTADMPALMRWADLAVSAAGSTCWEFCHLGVPAVLLVTADNQRGIAAGLHSAGAALSLGKAGHVTVERIREAVVELAGDPGRRSRMSGIGQELVDGKGSERVVAALTQHLPVGV